MKLKIYILKENYVNYLRNSDNRVPDNKSQTRPYIGIILKQDDFDYFSPLSSPKEKHKSMKNRMDFIKIDDGKLGIINLNNSVPVVDNELILLDIYALKNSGNINDRKYGILCQEQIIWCDNNFERIEKNFKKLYQLKTSNRLPQSISDRCCNFRLLEEKAVKYKNENIINAKKTYEDLER